MDQNQENQSLLVPSLMVFLGGCSYGVLASIVKAGYQLGFSLPQITLGHYFAGSFLLWICLIPMARRISWRVAPLELLKTIGLGATMGLTGLFYNECLKTIPASIAVVLLFQFTWMGVFVESLLDRRKPDMVRIASILVLLAGTLLASGMFKEASAAELNSRGLLMGLLSAVTYTTFIYSSGRVGTTLHPLQKSAIMLTATSALLVILLPANWIFTDEIPLELWQVSFALGLLGAFVPALLFSSAMPKVGVGLGSILSASELPVGVCAAHLIWKEDVSPIQWVGIATILLGIILPELKRRALPRLIA